jgi:hypothetical protein
MPILGSRAAGAASAFGLTSGGIALEVDYLLVAGGGAGAQGFNGGGGAGGYRSSFPDGTKTLLVAPVTNITVGSGGAAPPAGQNQAPSTVGENSDIGGTIQSSGGGTGGSWQSAEYPVRLDQNISGGSGGGSNQGVGGGAPDGNLGGQGNKGGYTPVEGYPGGSSGSNYSSSGGGGASAAGQPAGPGPSGQGGNGGNGDSNAITGSVVFYAGGGGGSVRYAGVPFGAGGSGGGGQSANSDTPTGALGTPGTDGLGGGGGGSFYSNSGPVPGSNGGSGRVVIRIPAATAPATVAVAPGTNTLTTDGPTGDKICNFTVDGTLSL